MDKCQYCLVRLLYYEAWAGDRLIAKRMKNFSCLFKSKCGEGNEADHFREVTKMIEEG